MRTAPLLFLTALALPASSAPRLSIVSAIDGQPPSPGWKYVRAAQEVTLFAQLTPSVPGTTFSWFKLEPDVGSVDNTSPSFHFEPIPYRATEVESCRGADHCRADPESPRWADVQKVPGTGTMAYQLKATLPDGTVLTTPGAESRERGGLSPAVHRITFRRDDTYLGYLTELFNTPFIFGSAGPDGQNQTDRLVGADCADLAVYGARRSGWKVPYVNTYRIDQHAPEFQRAIASRNGLVLDARGQPIRIGQGPGEIAPGDLLHFPKSRHVAVFYEDREPKGVLDEGDLMLHTCWAPPRLEAIGQSNCASFPWRLLRFRAPPDK